MRMFLKGARSNDIIYTIIFATPCIKLIGVKSERAFVPFSLGKRAMVVMLRHCKFPT
jgi:hypothetical protein